MTARPPAREPLRVLWRAAVPTTPLPPLPGVEVRVARELDAAMVLKDWAEVLVDGRPSELLDGERLRHVLVPWAGLDPALREALLARPHLRGSNSHYNATFVAQHLVALLLAVANRVVEADAALRRFDWGRRDEPLRSMQLQGRRALLLGYGRIGRAAVPMLKGFGLRLTAMRRHPGHGDAGVREVAPETLLELLPQVDAVLCSLPATPSTDGLMDARALRALPHGALVVNVGRGAVFDQDALYEALRDGHLGGAGLDVWYRYPEGQRREAQPADRPFWELPTVVLSPHRADASVTSERARVEDVCATLVALARGEERSPLDIGAGY
jgi:D-2-hydroxyacid dehydrogenase (NADP+)